MVIKVKNRENRRNEVGKVDLKYMLKDFSIDPEFIESLTIPSLDGEIWMKINNELYPKIKPYYFISNKARIYNYTTKKFIKTRKLDPNKNTSPYYKVNLQIEIDGHSFGQVFLVHRLMMSTFYPIEGMEKLLVNHKDGNKCNDELTNLEWMTPSGNILHAIKTGLFKPVYGEKHCCATISEDTAKKIIKLLLVRRCAHKQVAEIVGTTESIVDSIASKKAWKHLTNELDFSSLRYRLPKCFTLDQIKMCCKYFEENKINDRSIRRYCMDCLISIKYDRPLNESVVNSVRLLYQKKRYQYISKNYNF